MKPWDLTFFRQFPQEKNTYIDSAKALITAFAAASTNKDMCPDVADGLDVLKDHIIRTFNLLRNQTETAFEEMKKVVKKSHKQAVPVVKEFLEDMYEHCASESGKSCWMLCSHHAAIKLTSHQGEVITPETRSSSKNL